MANVFISHRGQDSAQAETLANAIRSAGHEVWIDLWKIDLGDSIVRAINDGLSGAGYVIICCSAAGTESPWMSREWMSTLARQLNGYPVKVLPALFVGGSPPAMLADIKYADLSGEWSVGLAALLAALR